MFADIKPHLAALQKTIGYSVLSVIIAFIVAFTFHNPILTWITEPLNNALTEVGRIIDSQEKATWHLKAVAEANASKIADENTTKTTVENNGTEATILEVTSPMIQSAHNLQESLEKAVSIANKELVGFLQDAVNATKELTLALKSIENNGTKKASTFDGQITTHQVGGAFFVALKVSFFAGLLGALPFILYQLWLFIAPGLYDNEKKMVAPFVIGGSFMFFVGVLFAYYIVTPFGFQFLITFGSFLYTPLINIEDYVGFFAKIMMGFGIAFELPVIAYFLAVLGIITDKSLKDFFKYAVIMIFVLSAMLTPPDVLTQLLMAGPLILLYGLSIIIVKYVNPHEEEEDEDEQEDNYIGQDKQIENKK
jgi:sec-independent protein translocase protein TatC